VQERATKEYEEVENQRGRIRNELVDITREGRRIDPMSDRRRG
jgi:hypothetical protein